MIRSNVFRYFGFLTMLAALLLASLAPASAQTADFTQSVAKLSSNSARVTFTPTAASTTQILHYVSPALFGGVQQNVNMNSAGAGVYTYDIVGLAAGNSVSYSFTYTKNGLQYDSALFVYAFDSVPTPTLPAITTQPASKTVTVGKTAAFSVVATGTSLQYQWRKNGTAISGATSASYTTPVTALADSGSKFSVVVKNSAGSVTSSSAILTVSSSTTSPIAITTQPASRSVTVGQSATFSVVVTGSSPTYQWRKNGTAISGATSASYTTPATVLADNGALFSVVVKNSLGSVTSGNATLSVSADTGVPNFGPNVKIFDPLMSSASIQQVLSDTFTKQESNQFGTERYAFMFKPGYYENDANIGFYTHVLGLGLSPDDVRFKGEVHIEALWEGNGNSTQNFWRSAENMQVTPSKTMRWAAAQAVPLRRMHINGSLILSYYGWASGGYIADSKIDNIYSSAQQQWITRNSEITSWYDSVWNMVFVGVTNAPANTFPSPPMTTIDQTPVSREKPFLYIDSTGKYNVFVPALKANSKGASWTTGTTAGSSLPISQFYIVRSDNASAANINAALAQGKNLLFTPGVYHLSDTIRITRADTVVLGLGLATLIPDNGVVAMSVADVDGVKLAGLLFDAGTVSSPVMLEVGPTGSSANHAANPTSLFDIFMRVGGTGALGKAKVGLIINSHNVIGDHFWLWRADHGQNVGWDLNTSETGLIVNGNNVTLYGLFVEHFQKHNVIWNGNGGKTYFFQNELPYDVPNQAVWMNGSNNGYAAYKVSNTVTSHEGWGMGSYCYFNVNPTVNALHSYEVPNVAGVKFHNLTTVSLGGVGSISHVINNSGGVADKAQNVQTWLNYP